MKEKSGENCYKKQNFIWEILRPHRSQIMLELKFNVRKGCSGELANDVVGEILSFFFLIKNLIVVKYTLKLLS